MSMTSVSDPMVGYALGGRYEITGRIARGGMAVVYLATDTRLSRPVAVKLMHESLGDNADFALKFDREARAAAQLSSQPTIVSVFDQGTDLGRPYIVMEYVEGETLRNVISREGAQTPLRALELMEPVLSALATAHQHGIVHRDIKPENVLISVRGQVKVADFGLAKAVTGSDGATQTQGMVMGTVSYIPPELVQRGRCDPRSDVYSAGIVLYELLTGRKPYTGDSPIQIAYAHCNEDLPAPSRGVGWRGDSIPGYVDALVQSAAARDPEQRPADAGILLGNLRLARGALERGVRQDPRLEAAIRRTTRRSADVEHTVDFGRSRSPVSPNPGAATVIEPGVARPTGAARPRPPARGAASNAVIQPAPPVVAARRRPAPARAGASSVRPRQSSRAAETTKRRRGLALLVVVLVLALLLSLAAWWATAGRLVSTPTLIGLSQDAAVSTATSAKLRTAVATEFSETVPVGDVVRTDPTSGARVSPQSLVTIYISQGPERTLVPDVAGQTVDKAKAAVEQAKLTWGVETTTYSETVPAGAVVSTAPAAGTSSKPGTAVDYVTSLGRPLAPVPTVAGQKEADARQALETAGFQAQSVTATSATVPAGTVISQTPQGVSVPKGSVVTLTVSSGPEQIPVPDVVGKSMKDARKILEDAGFAVVEKKSSLFPRGEVVSTDPAAGTKAARGSTITVTTR